MDVSMGDGERERERKRVTERGIATWRKAVDDDFKNINEI